MNIKFILGIISVLFIITGYIPYLKDIFNRKTSPHLYTWLIWGITQSIATIALLYGGGGSGSFSLITGTILVGIIFLLSFKYGTKDITFSDKIILFFALLAIFIWWRLNNPFISVLLISIIDGVGYIPTIRKSIKNPWGETISFWLIMAMADILAISANVQYNFFTMIYLVTLFVADMIIALICFFGRKRLKF